MLLSVEESVEEAGSRCEVGCQWERPKDQCKEVGVQSSTEHTDVAVQVDLIGLCCRRQGSHDVPWHCFTVREDEPGGGALWQHCSSHNNNTMTFSPPALSSVLLCASPTRTPQKDTQNTPPSQPNPSEHTTPCSIHQSDLSIPSMPLCGESPSTAHKPSPEELESMGFLAPLSSDEEEASEDHQDQQFDEGQPPVKRGRGRRRLWMNCNNTVQNSTNHVNQSSSETETKKRRRRKIQTNETKTNDDQRPKRKSAGLPLRYLQDYDMESHGPISTNQVKEGTETQKCNTNLEDQEKSRGEDSEIDKASSERVLFLPYYKQSLKVEQLLDYKNLTKQQSKAELGSIDPNEDQMPRLLPLKLKQFKNVEKTGKSQPPVSKKIDWQIFDNVLVKKEAKEEDEDSDLKLKLKTIKQEDGMDETPSMKAPNKSSGEAEVKSKVISANKKTIDLTKYKRILINQEDVEETPLARKQEERKQAMLASNSDSDWSKSKGTYEKRINPVVNMGDLNIVKVDHQLIHANASNGEKINQLHLGIKRRGRGRPRKNSKLKQDVIEIRPAVLMQQQDRPRRTAVGPPVRYLLESEEVVERTIQLSPEAVKRRGKPRKIQIESTEVGETLKDSQWPPEELTNEDAVFETCEAEDASSFVSQMTVSYEDTESVVANQNGDSNGLKTDVGRVVCKMFVQGQDGNWTEQEAQTLKLKDTTNELLTSQDGNNSGKIYSSLETVKIANHEIETAKGVAEMGEDAASQGQPEILIFKVQDDMPWIDVETAAQMQSATEVCAVENDDCEITYEYEDIKNFHYEDEGVYKGCISAQSGKTVGGSHIQWANQNTDDKMHEWEKPNDRGEGDRKKKKRRSNFEMFLVHQDVDTGKTTFIPPCFVQLQQLIIPF